MPHSEAGGRIDPPVSVPIGHGGAPPARAEEKVFHRHGRQLAAAAVPALGDPQVGPPLIAFSPAAPQLEHLLAGDLAAPDAFGLPGGRLREQVAHDAPGLGTRKPPLAMSGAPRSAVS